MGHNQIDLKSIRELRGMNFFIPDYQRGYRWTKQQVDDLLDDIWEFMNNDSGGWYSLQPVVVTRNTSKKTEESFRKELLEITKGIEDSSSIMDDTVTLVGKYSPDKYWEVVDGQQRLTSLFILLKYLDKENNVFSIDYETRNVGDGNSSEFLNNIDDKTEDDASRNIDYYHMFQTYNAIHAWFNDTKKALTDELKEKYKETILDSVKVIWYEVKEKPIDVFTRINSGKIPLTNAELIKALFLNSSNFKDADAESLRLKQLEIASEWDRIECSLQDDSFWLFLNKENDHLPTRIEFIFHLMYQLEEDKLTDNTKRDEFDTMYGNDNYSTFRFFNQKFKVNSEESSIEDIVTDTWLEVKKLYQTLEEWYDDRKLYHKVGYLITVDVEIIEIIKGWKGKTKKEFKEWLNQLIKKEIDRKKLEELEYGTDNEQITKMLLLHNVTTATWAEDESHRFPFYSYKDQAKGGWSLEHIHAQSSKEITEVKDFESWLKEINDEYLKAYETNIEKAKKGEMKIQDVINKISSQFGDIDVHTIDNLALLMRDDNSKLNIISIATKENKKFITIISK